MGGRTYHDLIVFPALLGCAVRGGAGWCYSRSGVLPDLGTCGTSDYCGGVVAGWWREADGFAGYDVVASSVERRVVASQRCEGCALGGDN